MSACLQFSDKQQYSKTKSHLYYALQNFLTSLFLLKSEKSRDVIIVFCYNVAFLLVCDGGERLSEHF
jgi:hypothetical protein